MFMLLKLNLETFTLDFCQIEQLITCLRPLGHKKWLHSTSLFTILVFCWGVTFSIFLCQFVIRRHVMINDVMMHDVTNVNIMWAMVMFIFMFMLESSWHLALDVWLVVYVHGPWVNIIIYKIIFFFVFRVPYLPKLLVFNCKE